MDPIRASSPPEMPLNPIVPSLLLFHEVSQVELLELNEKYPKFLWETLTRTGYSTLHLMPKTFDDSFDEFNSWPQASRDLPYFQMTQRKKAVDVKLIKEYEIDNFSIEKGVINVIKFRNTLEFLEKAEILSSTPDCCFTVLLTVKEVPETSPVILSIKSFLDFQQSLKLSPSALVNCPSPDWTRYSVSISKGSDGEFRVRSEETNYGLFGSAVNWRGFAGGITQLYSLKAELSYVIGITGKYGD